VHNQVGVETTCDDNLELAEQKFFDTLCALKLLGHVFLFSLDLNDVFLKGTAVVRPK
jgi:hypothetical protein